MVSYVEDEDLVPDRWYKCKMYNGEIKELYHFRNGLFNGGLTLYGDVRYPIKELNKEEKMSLSQHYRGEYETISIEGHVERVDGKPVDGEEFERFFDVFLAFVESEGYCFGGGINPEPRLD